MAAIRARIAPPWKAPAGPRVPGPRAEAVARPAPAAVQETEEALVARVSREIGRALKIVAFLAALAAALGRWWI